MYIHVARAYILDIDLYYICIICLKCCVSR